jgi:hypothetical protein
MAQASRADTDEGAIGARDKPEWAGGSQGGAARSALFLNI